MRWLNERVYVVPTCLAGLCVALFVFGVCGACSNGLDVDHPVGLVWKGLPLTWENLCTRAGRPLHIPTLVIVGCLCLVGHARFYRLLVCH